MNTCQPGGMVDAVDSKSTDGNIIRVQVPWLVPMFLSCSHSKMLILIEEYKYF